MAESADDIGAGLVAWMGALLPSVPANTRPLAARTRENGIDLRLFRATPRALPRTTDPPFVVDLDFLITVQMVDAAAEQRTLAELLLAAMDRREGEIIGDVSVADLCSKLGIPSAAGFVLRVPLTRERPAQPVRRVRQPLVVHTSEMGVIEGRVVSMQNVPVAGATVSANALNKSVRSDHDGYFRMAGMPSGASRVTLTARAHGAEVDAMAADGKTVVLRLPLEV